MNPHKFSVVCFKKKQLQLRGKKLFVEKKYDKFQSIFFTRHWLTKYTFSSIYKNPQAPKKNCEYSLAYFYPFFFQTYTSAIKKKIKKSPSSKKCV